MLGKRADEIVNEAVVQYTGELEKFITQVEEYLEKVKDGSTKLSDQHLHRMILRLPVLQYHLIDIIDRAQIDSDVSKGTKELVYSQHLLSAEGNIPERQAQAVLDTADETLIVDLSKHCHARLKQRMEVCSDMLDALKKVLTSRDIERQLFGRDRSG